MHVTRLRQVVVAARDLGPLAEAMTAEFSLGTPFHDPGVAEFGLRNAVFPIGDCFFEIVSPSTEGTTAGRYIERHGGDAGYMVIFQVDDIAAARDHLRAEQCRTVWNADLPTISGTHLHPGDIGGAIVSVDEPRPPASWMWAGAGWEQRCDRSVVSGVAGCTVADTDPDALAARWSRLLRLDVTDRSTTLDDGSTVRFAPSADFGGRSGLVGIDLRAADAVARGRRTTFAGVDFTLV